jgi:NACHT domain
VLDGEIVNAAWAVVQMAATPRTSRRASADLDTAAWGDTERLIKDALAGIRTNPGMPDLGAEEEAQLFGILRRHEVQGALQALLAVRLTDAPEVDAVRAREAVRLAVVGAAEVAARSEMAARGGRAGAAGGGSGAAKGAGGLRAAGAAAESWAGGNAGTGGRRRNVASGQAPRFTAAKADPDVGRGARRLSEYFDDKICGLVGSLEGRVGLEGLAQVRAEAYNARIVALLGAIEGQLGALGDAGWRAEAEEEFIRRYRRQAHLRHGFLTPPDFDRRRRVPVDVIYVPTGIREEIFSEGRVLGVLAGVRGEGYPGQARLIGDADDGALTTRLADNGSRTVWEAENGSLTVWDLEGLVDRTVLLGDPGGGKTTAANVLTDRFARDEAKRIPFLVTLREYAAKAPIEWSVAECIEQGLGTLYQTPGPDGLVERLLLTGRAVVIFDGLDELLDTSRRRDVSDRVEQFCSAYPLTPVLVTSRVVGYDQARLDDAQFTCYRLGGFGDDEVAAYAGKWFASQVGTQEWLSVEEASAKAAAFLTESASVRDLRANPLLLSLMCILYRGVGSLPGDRVGIYAKCAELLLRKWDEQRDLYRKLGSDHLVEPTLRHLAWWLLTREDNRTTASEHELVAETTEFMRQREYETLDEAERAAREFVDFCRGRMWVFSDAGTTADGEKLYAFTHRTFMEYFAAWNLAATSDTPEDLVRELAALVSTVGWHVVGELAVKIKSDISMRGADRIYTEFINLAPASNGNSGEILAFLVKCIESARPSQAIVRLLTRSVLDYIFFSGYILKVWSAEEDEAIGAQPASLLINRSEGYYSIVDDEISGRLANMINSGQTDGRRNALQFAAEIAWGSRGSKAGQWARTLLSRYPAEITAEAAVDTRLMNTVLAANIVTTRQALAMPNALSALLQRTEMKFTGFWTSAWLPFIGAKESDDNKIEELTVVGQHLVDHPGRPWAKGKASDLLSFPLRGMREGSQLDEYSGLAVAATVAMICEAARADRARSAVFDYPMPAQFRELFTRWAAGEVDLVEIVKD